MHPLSTLIIPEVPVFCNLQLVHASADTSLHTIDVRVNNSQVADSLLFESASAFFPVQCNDPVVISLARHDNPSLILYTDTIQPEANQTHRLILWGILDTPNYNPAPELDWFIDENLTLTPSSTDNFDLRFFHAATDLGSVQVNEASIPIVPLFIATENGEMSSTLSLAAQLDYGAEIVHAPTQFSYGSFGLPAHAWQWENKSITILSTGFRQPANNSQGQSFELWALEPDGTMRALDNFVHVLEQQEDMQVQVMPNPASQIIRVLAVTGENGTADIHIINRAGKELWHGSTIIRNGRVDQQISLDAFAAGNYSLILELNGKVLSAPFHVIR